MRRLTMPLAVALAVALAPGVAHGSTASVRNGVLVYAAGAAETNTLLVATAGTGIELTDAPAVTITVDPTTGCSRPAGYPANQARCTAPPDVTADITLGDGDDTLQVDDSFYPLVPAPGDLPVVLAQGEAGTDTLDGGIGVDELYGGSGADVVRGGGGDDLLYGSMFLPDPAPDGDDVVDGGPGDDQVVDGGPGNDTVLGGNGDEQRTLDGGPGDDVVDGGPGADVPRGGDGDDVVRGGAGDDIVEAEFGPPIASPGAGRDRLEGGPGDDALDPGPSAPLEGDTFSGGDGTDTVSYAARLEPVAVYLDGIADDGAPGEGDDVLGDVEHLVGTSDSDTLAGSPGPDILDGGPGDDLVSGLGGDDRLEGGTNDSGSDTLDGGDGADILRGSAGDDQLIGGTGDDDLAGAGGTDSLVGDDGQDTMAGGPGLDALDGGAGDDTLYGFDATLLGADGADELVGGSGDDTLLAGPGNDRLDGGPGADRMNGDDGRDAVSYEDRTAPVSVTFDGVANDGEAGEGDNVAADVESVLGSTVGDTLLGDTAANVLDGSSGDDLIDGSAGQDDLLGGTGVDVLRARDGEHDVVSCGEDRDLVVVDRQDTVRDCEYVNRPRLGRPAAGRTALVRDLTGSPTLRLPGSSRHVPLDTALKIPLGSRLDTRASSVRLRAAAVRRGRREAFATFSDGQFSVSQSGGRLPATVLRLRGGDFSACTASPSRGLAAAAARRRTVRVVWGKGKGRFRTKGRYSIGGVRGTWWATEDRCDGTLTRVKRGVVRVRDLVRHRTVMVHAGESYLARAPRRGG